MVRSNGVLSGAVFLLDFWMVGWRLMAGEEGGVSERWRAVGRLVGLGIGLGGGGVLVGAGLAFPPWLLAGGTALLMRGRGRSGVGVATLFLAFASFCRSGIGLFSILPPPTLWPEIN